MNALLQRARPYLVLACRIAVALVFVYAAVPKIVDPAQFASDIANYRVPHWMWNLSAATVPMLEVLGAAAILHPRRYRVGAIVLGALTLVFLVMIYSVIARGIDVDCGCFGQSEVASKVGWELFGRDVLLLLGVVIAGLPRWPPAEIAPKE